MKKILIAVLFVTACYMASYAGEDSTAYRLLTSAIKTQQSFGKQALLFIDRKDTIKDVDQIGKVAYHQLQPLRLQSFTKPDIIDHDVYLYFRVRNDETLPRRFFVTAGIFNNNNRLFLKNSGTEAWKPAPVIRPDSSKEQAYYGFLLEPGEENEYFLRTRFIPSNIATISPVIIDENFFSFYINYNHTHWNGLDKFTYISCGTLLLMVLFSLATFVQYRKKEFLYYSLYTLFMCALLLFKALNFKLSTPLNLFQEVYLDLMLQLSGFIFYIAFTRNFLNTAVNYPRLNSIFCISEFILLGFMTVFSCLVFSGSSFSSIYYAENLSKYFLIALGLLYIIVGLAQKNKLMNYLVAGNLANLVFGSFSLLLIHIPSGFLTRSHPILKSALLYFEIGILLELILFLIGLSYKNRMEMIEKVEMEKAMHVEAERLEYQQQIAIMQAQQQERMRISADMHDELGAGVTAIRLLSEIAIRKTREHPLEEIPKISENANELMAKMNAIIWSMNPGNDTLPAFLSYFRAYASEYLENLNIKYHFQLPEHVPDLMISGEKRRNLFLVIKEALNNIVKHAGATRVDMEVVTNHELKIRIRDNGTGISTYKLNQFGNGLKNMKRRMELSGGSFTIYTDKGTTIELTIPY